MKKEDLQYIKETLEYALNDCPVKDGDHETHFNTFANAISLVDDELNLLTIPDVVGQSEQLVAFLKWVGDGYDFENNAEKIVKEYIDEGN